MGVHEAVAALGFAVVMVAGSACTWGSSPAPPTNPPPAPGPTRTAVPPPGADAPAAPMDNCGLNPADMDDKTKAQCGLLEKEPATGGEDTSDGSSGRPEDSDGAPHGGSGDGSTGSGGDSTYEQFQDRTSYPYNEDEYEQLPGYLQCGTACGKEPTSGEIQQQYGCEQGYITEGC